MGITLRAMDMTIRTRDITTRAKGKRKLLILCTACLSFGILSLYCSPAWAQDQSLLPASPPVSVGSGARAQGMGGAFIAVADDATAASWNPGGLGQLQRPEMSVVGSYFLRTEDYDASQYGASLKEEGGSHSSISDLNYFSFAYAKKIWQRNMFFSLNYQKVFDFGRRLKLEFPPSPGDTIPHKVDYQREGALYTFSPAMSIEIIPGLYAGVTDNIWSDNITEKSRWKVEEQHVFPKLPDPSILKSTSEYTDFRGQNQTFGFLWKITQQLQLGGVYKTPFKARVKTKQQWISILGSEQKPFPSKEEAYRIDFPAAYGVGLSYKLGNSWTFAGDVTRTQWQDYIIHDSTGAEVGPFATSNGKAPKKDPTNTVRLGAEYALILDKPKITIPLRFGLFYDPEPSVNAPQDFYGVSGGFGIADDRLSLDFAYQFRTGKQVSPHELDITALPTEGGGVIKQHLFLCSLILYF
jgi:long-subunit fatty acid transport protein